MKHGSNWGVVLLAASALTLAACKAVPPAKEVPQPAAPQAVTEPAAAPQAPAAPPANTPRGEFQRRNEPPTEAELAVAAAAQKIHLSRELAIETMKKAATYFRAHAAAHGGYVYYVSLDFTQRWGEGVAGPEEIWIQPPGTPAVGQTFLKAWQATGDQFYLDAAIDAGEALIYGQLPSGGWRNRVNFLPPKADPNSYYSDPEGINVSSLDDDESQAATRFLVDLDRALNFTHKDINMAARFALDSLMGAQNANGGFMQGWKQPAAPHPILKASYPETDYRTETLIHEYWENYTLNDNVCRFAAMTFAEAYKVYGDQRYMDALRKLGDFFILAQMPDPQPGWCQQYNFNMQPVWARRFEPAALCGLESQGAMETLMDIYTYTGDAKYLEPIPRALEYYKSSLLPDGRLARFYELKTNKPLYMTRDEQGNYHLTYEDKDLPSHYGWKVRPRLDAIERRYNSLKNGVTAETTTPDAGRFFRGPADPEMQVREIIAALDSEGRWIGRAIGSRENGVRIGLTGQPKFPSPDFQYLASAMFSRCMDILSDYVVASRPATAPVATNGK